MKSDVQKLMQKFKDTDIPIIEAAFVKVYLQKKNIFFENSRFICSYLESGRGQRCRALQVYLRQFSFRPDR